MKAKSKAGKQSTNNEAPVPRSPLVYVVDDDPSVRKGLSRLLHAAGYGVEVFPSASEFLANMHVSPPTPETPRSDFHVPTSPSPLPRSELPVPHSSAACVVLDVQMPGLSGIDLQETLGGGNDSLPIIFITGHGDIPMSVRAMKKGAVDFLAKPFEDVELLDAVAVALRRDEETRRRRAEIAAIREREQTLTTRERAVMSRVITGMLNKQIAAELGIEEGTVKVHRGRVMHKMGIPSVAELVVLCNKLELGTRSSERGMQQDAPVLK
jgi:FixJ family two-component response regulator